MQNKDKEDLKKLAKDSWFIVKVIFGYALILAFIFGLGYFIGKVIKLAI